MCIVPIVSITANTLRSALWVYGNFYVIAFYDKISILLFQNVRTPTYFYRKVPVFPFLKCGNASLYREYLVKIFVIFFTNFSFTKRIGV
ncbi:hypothetical protein LBK6_06710 [Leptospira borgpetersenii serovar Hardjo]|nr:hypothetical protein LBK6_06710 [Leptospira borgpetersenii serovar Hardjo]AMX61294.1 hypothetical protein LBK9_06735 [Leptospira borgpetersenii serovar Hardjo]AMX64539.1 hypothetical protein LBK30_06790 [Leptospira borgpetersenii serovar Hardjo]AMX67757.1 hypothetical protein LBHA_06655 [Leptospira borgpetersenii serovar Hardjo]AMX70973.1 hypothetical protein LBHB_06625 [Leptospira borgpetersenii serovar Hardjo]